VYRRSPYFEYYEHRFEPFYAKKETFLFDWNLNFLELLMEVLEIEAPLEFTTEFEKKPDANDQRSALLPRKTPDPGIKYRQVFEERVGFLPDMSVIDLLFSEGPNAGSLL
jgi:hypothetical protein